jgi:hypothetical protein
VDRSLARIGAGRFRLTTHNTLERYEDVGGMRTAVIGSTGSAPLRFTIDFGKLLSSGGPASSQFGLPSGTNVSAVYRGSISVSGTSWVDIRTGQLVNEISTSTFDMRFRFRGFPQAGRIGPLSFSGSMSFQLERT